MLALLAMGAALLIAGPGLRASIPAQRPAFGLSGPGFDWRVSSS